MDRAIAIGKLLASDVLSKSVDASLAIPDRRVVFGIGDYSGTDNPRFVTLKTFWDLSPPCIAKIKEALREEFEASLEKAGLKQRMTIATGPTCDDSPTDLTPEKAKSIFNAIVRFQRMHLTLDNNPVIGEDGKPITLADVLDMN